jgi:hypothetical protein
VHAQSLASRLLPPCLLQVMSDWTDTGIQRANLNLLLKFVSLGSSGTEAIYSPRETLGVGPITVNIATEGFYYLGVAGSPAGNPYDSGFSSYASLGSYSLTAVYATPASIPAWIPPPSISNPYVPPSELPCCCTQMPARLAAGASAAPARVHAAC